MALSQVKHWIELCLFNKVEMNEDRVAELKKDKQRMKYDEEHNNNTFVTLMKRKHGGLFWNVLFHIQVSRPFLWLATLWLYSLSTAVRFPHLFKTWTWWIGLFYMGWPVNYLQFAPNDYSDLANDAANPRKRSFFTGAHYTRAELDSFPAVIFYAQVPFFIFSYFVDGIASVMYLFFAVAINVVYNGFPNQKWAWRNIPILELCGPLGFVPATPFGAQLNNVEHVTMSTIIPLILFCFQLQLWGEIWDDVSDRKAGRVNTTNTILGLVGAKIVIVITVLLESIWLLLQYEDYYLGYFGLLSCVMMFYGYCVPRQNQFKIHMNTLPEFSFVMFSCAFAVRAPFLTFNN